MTNKNLYDLPKEKVTLPSNGKLYPTQSPMASGYIELQYPTAKNQDILTSTSLIKKGVMIDQFIKSLILTPKVKFNELLTFDRDKLIFVSRAMAYTAQYKTIINCPQCQKQNQIKVDLNTLQESVLQQGIVQNRIEVTLPLSKKLVTFKFLTVQQQQRVTKQVKQLQNARRNIDGATPQISTRLKRMITSVDGNNDELFISNFVDNYMPSNDALFLRKYIKGITPGIINKFNFECKHCGYQKELAVPLTAQFFYPDLAE